LNIGGIKYIIKTIMETYVLEIKNSEGGEDSKLLVDEMCSIYQKAMQKNNFAYKIVSRRFGFVSI
jgi:protein subunit release factor A